MPAEIESSLDSCNGIALLYLEKSRTQGVDFTFPVSAQIGWEPAHLKLLYHVEQNEFLWKTSEPEIEDSRPYEEYAIRQYREAREKDFISGKNQFSSIG